MSISNRKVYMKSLYEISISNRKVYTKSLHLIENSVNCNLLTLIIHLTFGSCRVNISKCIAAVNEIRTSRIGQS